MEYTFKDELTEISLIKSFTKEESKILKKGISANSMDDKWKVVFENNELNFYRSWTGFGIFKLKVKEENECVIVTNAYVLNKMVEASCKEYWEKLLNWLIEYSILNKEADFPKFTDYKTG